MNYNQYAQELLTHYILPIIATLTDFQYPDMPLEILFSNDTLKTTDDDIYYEFCIIKHINTSGAPRDDDEAEDIIYFRFPSPEDATVFMFSHDNYDICNPESATDVWFSDFEYQAANHKEYHESSIPMYNSVILSRLPAPHAYQIRQLAAALKELISAYYEDNSKIRVYSSEH